MEKNIIKITETELRDIISENVKKFSLIYESGLNRILSWINSYDIVTITAFRDKLKDITNNTYIPNGMSEGDSFTLQQNRERNRLLKAKLLSLGYGVTNIHGSYIEGQGTEVAEESFLVVNLKDDKNFYKNCFKLSEYFNQDSFLYKAKNSDNAYLVGTNMCDFPSYDNRINAGTLTSLPSKFMSRIKNAAFAFVDKDNWVIKNSKADMTDDNMNDYENSYSWKNDDKPTFNKRKEMRKIKMIENLLNNNGLLLETFNGHSINTKHSISLLAKQIKLN